MGKERHSEEKVLEILGRIENGETIAAVSGGESRGASCRHRCLEAAGALQAFLPVTDGLYGDAEVLGNRLP